MLNCKLKHYHCSIEPPDYSTTQQNAFNCSRWVVDQSQLATRDPGNLPSSVRESFSPAGIDLAVIRKYLSGAWSTILQITYSISLYCTRGSRSWICHDHSIVLWLDQDIGSNLCLSTLHHPQFLTPTTQLPPCRMIPSWISFHIQHPFPTRT